jgi:hypothetical protein
MSENITITEMSSVGPIEHKIPFNEAVDFLINKVKINSLWLYINGTETNPDKLTEEDLKKAESIVLGNQLLGG